MGLGRKLAKFFGARSSSSPSPSGAKKKKDKKKKSAGTLSSTPQEGSVRNAAEALALDLEELSVSGAGSRRDRSNYGSSSHGGHGRERFYDEESAKSFGRQHGGKEMINLLTAAEAKTIPISGAFTVHSGERSGSFVRGENGEFVARGDGGTVMIGTSPSAVVNVHTPEFDGDAGSIGAAGERRRGSHNSLLLLEAQALQSQGVNGAKKYIPEVSSS
jgi:hypothetical protein